MPDLPVIPANAISTSEVPNGIVIPTSSILDPQAKKSISIDELLSSLNMAKSEPVLPPPTSASLVTNAEFISAIFSQLPEGAHAAVCSKPNDPTIGGWVAKRADQVADNLSTTNNNYLNCSSFNLDDDSQLYVRKDNFASYHLLMLDDIGTKIPLDRVDGFEFSYLLETSPGNFQAGIILAEPITNGNEANRLLDAVIAAGLCDAGATGAQSRWARLPVGINGKEKYANSDGKPFQCRLKEWNPESVYTLQEIVDSLKLELAPIDAPKLVKSSNAQQYINKSINTISSDDYPLSDANKVADACKQIGNFRDTKGAGQSEPQWRDCIGVTAYCEDGDAITQQWSSGYDYYDADKTTRKIIHRIQFAPTTCNQFKRTNPAGCVGCIQTCNSPVTLGWTDQHLLGFTPTETVIVDNTNSKVTPKQDVRSEALKAMQKQFALIKIGAKVWVIEGHGLNTHDNNGTVKKLELLNRGDGALLIHRALTAQFPSETNKVIDNFMLHPLTICYSGVEFNPRETTANHLNLWVGPTVTPKPGGWELIQAFLLTGICNGNQECYEYLIRYIAHALQKPWEKPGVMIILIGGQGLGKGTLGQILRKIWRATYLQVNNIDNVTGNFNASLERAFIVFMDEALFSGDRKATNALKSLVTEPVVHINEKHQPSRQTDSYLRIFLATNAEHVKNTERDDRRDFVLRVSEAHKGDKAYWDNVYHEIEHGGVEAMVHDLIAMDLSKFNVRYKPNTPELITQKLQSLNPIELWWHDCLYRGQMCKEDGDFIAESEKGWPAFISTHTAIEGVMSVTGGKAYRKPTTNDIVDSIKKLCPSAVNKQSQSGKVRHRGLTLPSLEKARKEFETYIGDSVPWPF